jgi:hypothetical protein
MLTDMKAQGLKQYLEALKDPRVRQIEPGLIMRPFHYEMPAGQEWHVYCERHPEFGFCGLEHEAASAALDHGNREH